MEKLSGFSLFRGVSEEDCRRMVKCLHAKSRWYLPEEVIFPSEFEEDQVGILLEGEARLLQTDVHGNETVLEYLGFGGVFGIESAFSGAWPENLTLRCTVTCQVLFFHRDQLTKRCGKACACHSQLMMNLLRLMAKRTVSLGQKVELLSRKTIRDKLLTYLEQESARQGRRKFNIPITQSDLSRYLCMDRCAMCRELSKMKQEGLVDFRGREFELLYER